MSRCLELQLSDEKYTKKVKPPYHEYEHCSCRVIQQPAEHFSRQKDLFLAYKMRTELAVFIWDRNKILKCKKRSYKAFLCLHQICTL